MGSSMRLTPWKRREGYQSWLEEFAWYLQEKETVTGDKCMALLEEQKKEIPTRRRETGGWGFFAAPQNPHRAQAYYFQGRDTVRGNPFITVISLSRPSTRS